MADKSEQMIEEQKKRIEELTNQNSKKTLSDNLRPVKTGSTSYICLAYRDKQI